jgi:beta-lysine 5,6-aminomutase alpha subunit
VLSSQFINEAFALRAGLREEQMGLGHAYEIDPWLEDSFLLEIAQAQLVRQIFDRHPIKWMPPTKHKTGDIFFAHVHDAMFDLVGVTTKQSIELLGMFSEAIQNPLLMDRYLALKATRYVYGAAKHLGDEIEFKRDGIVGKRAVQVLDEALALLEEVERESIWEAIGRGAFADVKRTRTGGKGYAGVLERSKDYVNPLLSALEADKRKV